MRAGAVITLVGAALGGVAGQSALAAPSANARYSIRVVNSGAGGGGAVFHTGSPINITVVDRRSKESRPITICLVPAAIAKPSCHAAHLNRTLDSLAPSAAGITRIRVKIAGTVLVRRIRVRQGPSGR
jgi:hypothetical protein